MMFDRRTHQGLTCMADAIAYANRKVNGHWLVGIKDFSRGEIECS